MIQRGIKSSCLLSVLLLLEDKQFLPWMLCKWSCNWSLPGWWVISEPTRRAAGKPARRSCRAPSSGSCPWSQKRPPVAQRPSCREQEWHSCYSEGTALQDGKINQRWTWKSVSQVSLGKLVPVFLLVFAWGGKSCMFWFLRNISRWPCLGREIRLDDLQTSLSTLIILWFCDVLLMLWVICTAEWVFAGSCNHPGSIPNSGLNLMPDFSSVVSASLFFWFLSLFQFSYAVCVLIKWNKIPTRMMWRCFADLQPSSTFQYYFIMKCWALLFMSVKAKQPWPIQGPI